MVSYTDELKEEIRSANDIVDVVSQYVTLKRSGRNFFGLCPFHKEKSPSFSVSPDRQYFHCFGCNKGGDVFTFVSEIERISFKETIELLAERAGIKLPIAENSEFNKNQYLKDRMYKINASYELHIAASEELPKVVGIPDDVANSKVVKKFIPTNNNTANNNDY